MFSLLLTFGFFFALVYGAGRFLGLIQPKNKRYSPELVTMVSRANSSNNPYRHFWNDAQVLPNGLTIVTCQNCTEVAITEEDLYTNCPFNRNPRAIEQISKNRWIQE